MRNAKARFCHDRSGARRGKCSARMEPRRIKEYTLDSRRAEDVLTSGPDDLVKWNLSIVLLAIRSQSNSIRARCILMRDNSKCNCV